LIDKTWPERLQDQDLWYHLAYLFICALGFCIHPLLYALLLFDIVASEETLRSVIRSVTRNWQSIIMTGLLALILVYVFSIVGYLYFQRDFQLEVDELDDTQDNDGVAANASPLTCDHVGSVSAEQCSKEAVNFELEHSRNSDDGEAKVWSCQTLRMCIITTLNWGLRNGGGIGDVLRNVAPHVFLCQHFFFNHSFLSIVTKSMLIEKKVVFQFNYLSLCINIKFMNVLHLEF
uniref:Ion_trans domain-containing protein n=1 Tax=Gongylonema pulchrum TaxID=637853 RepID=A0A183D2K4_9BILA